MIIQKKFDPTLAEYAYFTISISNQERKVYVKHLYAKKKGVSTSRISKLIADKKLVTEFIPQLGKDGILDCLDNDKHFENPKWNRGIVKSKPKKKVKKKKKK